MILSKRCSFIVVLLMSFPLFAENSKKLEDTQKNKQNFDVKKSFTKFALNYVTKDITTRNPKWSVIHDNFKDPLADVEKNTLNTLIDGFINAKDIFLGNENKFTAYQLALAVVALKQFISNCDDVKFAAVYNYIKKALEDNCPVGFWVVDYEFAEEFPYILSFAELMSKKWFVPTACLSLVSLIAYFSYKLLKR
jgi:hypothetical protein